MRHLSLYEAPFRIRRRPPGTPEPDYGSTLDQATTLSADGPLHAQGPGRRQVLAWLPAQVWQQPVPQWQRLVL